VYPFSKIFPEDSNDYEAPGQIIVEVDNVSVVKRSRSSGLIYPWYSNDGKVIKLRRDRLVVLNWTADLQDKLVRMTGSMLREHWGTACDECGGSKDICPGCGGVSTR
jgi:hypothetical protein